ncbi:MAG: NADH:ubiquinone reductase (Na(+)-transporting) subunit B [Candidatus Aminicenantes bacterium]|nr:NADH:ubiquinone reductase (Na(+)-transporting) subunit B [Candidatus Aminicenantes bacterium]
MKFLRRFLDKQHKHFDKGGKLETFKPLFETLDTFLYTPGTVSGGPAFVRDAINLKRMMMTVVYALIPAVLVALYNTGLQANLAMSAAGQTAAAGWRGSLIAFLGSGYDPGSILSSVIHGALYFLPLYIVTLAVGGTWEVIFGIVRKHEVNEGFLVTSLLFPLILPPTLPLWQAAIGISFGIVVGKEVFGGVGMNILNPALVSRAFLFFAYPGQISGDAVWVAVDGVTKATPLAELADPALQLTVSWQDAFFGLIPGSMGETSALACLIGAAILIFSGIGSWRIMASVTGGMVGLTLLLNLVGSSSNAMFAVTPQWHFVLGGFAFGMVYMATDPVTAAMTRKGQYVYGLLIGFLVVLVRVVNPAFPEGMMLAILFGNVFAPVIDKIFINANIKRRARRYVQ